MSSFKDCPFASNEPPGLSPMSPSPSVVFGSPGLIVAAMNAGEMEEESCPLHGADSCIADVRPRQLIAISDDLRNSQVSFTIIILTLGSCSGEPMLWLVVPRPEQEVLD
jgi:hypothetical protein